jgi:hypothetical protein
MIKHGKVDKLDFIVAGAQKCGTTALHYQLHKHPQIALPEKEERHFFDDEELFANEVDYEKLHESFKVGSRAVVAGEVTPIYLYWRPVMERIYTYRKGVKLIILLRNPIDRAFSQWNMQREREIDTLDFLDAVKAEPERQQKVAPLQSRRFSYIARGLYAEQLTRVFQFFPRYLVKVVRFEDLRKNFSGTINSIFAFIDVEKLKNVRNKERNPIRYAREITEDERRAVYPFFADDIAKLESLLEWNCSDWKM